MSVLENGNGMSSSFLELPSPTAKITDSEILPLLDPRREGPIAPSCLAWRGWRARRGGWPRHASWRPAAGEQPLLKRFVENRRVLTHARREILGHDRQEVHGIDAEWLADNFHIIDDVLREVRHDLPPGYDELLPKLQSRRSRAIPASTRWPWRWSRTPTASSTSRGSPGSSRRSRRSSP